MVGINNCCELTGTLPYSLESFFLGKNTARPLRFSYGKQNPKTERKPSVGVVNNGDHGSELQDKQT